MMFSAKVFCFTSISVFEVDLVVLVANVCWVVVRCFTLFGDA